MVFKATFNSMSAIVCVFGGGNRGKTANLPQVTENHIMLYRVHLTWADFELTTLVVICTDWIGKLSHHLESFTVAILTWLTVTEYMCHVSQMTNDMINL